MHESFFPLKPSFIEPTPLSFLREHLKNGAVNAPAEFWPSEFFGLSPDCIRDARLDLPVAQQLTPPVSLVPVRRLPRDHVAKLLPAKLGTDTAVLTQDKCDPVMLTPPLSGPPVLIFAPSFGWLGNDRDELIDKNSARRVVLSVVAHEELLTRHDFLRLTPVSHKAAMRGPHYQFWFPGELREVAAHLKNGTFGPKMAAPPCGFHSIGMGFVYRNKCTTDTAVSPITLAPSMFKVRAVVKGYTMVSGVDFGDTFAPTPNPTSIRLMIALSVQLGYKLKVADVETAFLQADMDKEVYVSMPAGYETCIKTLERIGVTTCDFKTVQSMLPASDDIVLDDKSSCRKLLKGVPGIKQGSRLFYIKMRNVLLDLLFVVCPRDPCVYWRIAKQSITIIAVWVDDLFCLVANDYEWSDIVKRVRESLTLVDKGDVEEFLGMIFKHNEDFSEVSVCQSISIGNLLQRAKMDDCHPAPTPCVPGFVLSKADSPLIPNANHVAMPNYRGLIALANYVAVWTRPDIVWVVNKLCKFMANPGLPHIAALKRLLRYLAGTKDVGLLYKRQLGMPLLKGYTDSSHADCVDTSRSTVAFNMFLWGNPVSWYSHLDTKVTTCTNHAEYCALFNGAKEAVYLSEWIIPLIPTLAALLCVPALSVLPVPLLVDNHGAFALANDPVGRFLNKHVRTEHHFTQELTADGIIAPVECDTADNIADIGTKALGPIIFAKHVASLVGLSLQPVTNRATVCMIHVVANGAAEEIKAPSYNCVETQTTDPHECVCAGTFNHRCGRPVPKCVSAMRPSSSAMASVPRISVDVREPLLQQQLNFSFERRLPPFVHSSVATVDLYRGVLLHFANCANVSSSI